MKPAVRITGGDFKGRGLDVPPGARPTEGRVREALFSMWGESVDGARVVDLSAGSGVVGLEAIGRGRDRDPAAEPSGGALPAGGGEGEAPSTWCLPILFRLDRQSPDADSRLLEHHDRAELEILFDHFQVCEQQSALFFWTALLDTAEQNDGRLALSAGREKSSEIGVGGDEDASLGAGTSEDYRVGGRMKIKVADVHRVMASAGVPLRRPETARCR